MDERNGGIPFESPDALRAYDDYRLMGPGRTLDGLLTYYRAQQQAGEAVPTVAIGRLRDWCREHHWDARCAEHEAYLAEKSEALVAEDRAVRKRRRLQDLDLVADLSRQLLVQLREQIAPYTLPNDPDTVIYPISLDKLVNLLPRLGAMLIQAQTASRAELGEDVQRHHVTIEQVVNAFPPELREPLREALYEELLASTGTSSRPALGE